MPSKSPLSGGGVVGIGGHTIHPKSPPPPPPPLSFSPHTIQLTPHHLNAMLYYLNAWNRLWLGSIQKLGVVMSPIQMQCNAGFMNCSYNVQL